MSFIQLAPKTGLLLLAGGLFLTFSQCKNDPKNENHTVVAPVFEHKQFEYTHGDCGASCVQFTASYPLVAVGKGALRDSVQQWVERSAAEICAQTEDGNIPQLNLEQSAASLKNMWAVDSAMSYTFTMRDTVLMANTNYAALRLDIDIFTGGAHPNTVTKLAVFDVKTGAIVPASMFIKDQNAILPLLDIAYRAEKKEAFDQGNAYMEGAIAFPTQCAFTEKGVLFHYNTYEISAYAVGDADIFLTWIDLGTAAANPN